MTVPWLDQFLLGVKTTFNGTAQLPQRPTQVFTGPGVVATDDPVHNQTIVTVAGGGSAPSQYTTSLVNGLNSNVSITNPSSIRFGGYTGAVILGGIAPATAPTAGQIYQLNFVVSGYPITIRNNDAASTNVNRILTGTGSDVLLPPGQAPKAYLVWDATLNSGAGGFLLQSTGVKQVDEFYVTDFGAIGDNSTDNYTAIMAAMNYASTLGGTVVFPPNGTGLTTYLTSNTIVVPAGVSLRGGGDSKSTVVELSGTNPSPDVIQISTDSIVEKIGIVHGPTEGIQNWTASSSAFTVGQYVAPAAPASVLLKCLSGTGPTGAHVPIGQLTAPAGMSLSGTSITGSSTGIYVDVTTGGALGTMKFTVSTNSGSSYGSTITTTAGNSFAYLIPGTGITLNIPGGALVYGTGVVYPSPLVVVSGAPNGAYTIDVAVSTGPLGTMAFSAAVSGTNKFNSNGGYTIGPHTSSSGNSWAYTDSGTGLTFTFYAGQYVNQSGPAYQSPSFGWSMAVGTTIVDDGYTWEVVAGGSCLPICLPVTNGDGGNCTVRDIYTNYGIASIVIDQSEGNSIQDCTLQGSLMGCIWLTNSADRTFGASGGYTNQNTIRGTNNFSSNGWGVINDGGVSLSIVHGNNFQSCPAGWLYTGGAYGMNVSGNYVETYPGVMRNSCLNSRQSTANGCFGMVCNGNTFSIAAGASALDLYNGYEFSAFGNWMNSTPSTAMFTGVSTMNSGSFEFSNFAQSVPIFDVLNYTNNTISLSKGSAGNWLPYLQGAQAIAMNEGSGSYVIVCYGPNQAVKLDTSVASGGTFTAQMPPSPTVGQRVTLKDFTAAGTFNWGTTPGKWSVGAGIKIENPNSPGTLVTAGTITAPAANGGAYTYEWVSEGAWLLVA